MTSAAPLTRPPALVFETEHGRIVRQDVVRINYKKTVFLDFVAGHLVRVRFHCADLGLIIADIAEDDDATRATRLAATENALNRFLDEKQCIDGTNVASFCEAEVLVALRAIAAERLAEIEQNGADPLQFRGVLMLHSSFEVRKEEALGFAEENPVGDEDLDVSIATYGGAIVMDHRPVYRTHLYAVFQLLLEAEDTVSWPTQLATDLPGLGEHEPKNGVPAKVRATVFAQVNFHKIRDTTHGGRRNSAQPVPKKRQGVAEKQCCAATSAAQPVPTTRQGVAKKQRSAATRAVPTTRRATRVSGRAAHVVENAEEPFMEIVYDPSSNQATVSTADDVVVHAAGAADLWLESDDESDDRIEAEVEVDAQEDVELEAETEGDAEGDVQEGESEAEAEDDVQDDESEAESEDDAQEDDWTVSGYDPGSPLPVALLEYDSQAAELTAFVYEPPTRAPMDAGYANVDETAVFGMCLDDGYASGEDLLATPPRFAPPPFAPPPFEKPSIEDCLA